MLQTYIREYGAEEVMGHHDALLRQQWLKDKEQELWTHPRFLLPTPEACITMRLRLEM